MTDINTDITDGGCTCCASTPATATASTALDSQETTGMTTTTYTVTGMTCGHCVAAVSAEIARLAGVNSVEVDLSTGVVAVNSAAPLAQVEVAAAVEEAGYQLTGTGTGADAWRPR